MTDITYPEDWREIAAPNRPVRIVSLDGGRVQPLEAGQRIHVHPDLFAPAIIAGCSVADGKVGLEEPHEDVVAKLEEAMRKILADGKPQQITNNGEPRVTALKLYVANFDEAQRAEAWENITALSVKLDEAVDEAE